MAYRQEVGALGEEWVAEAYIAEGFSVLTRNWRNGRAGELDVVVGRPSNLSNPVELRECASALIVFCEVKTRSSDRFGSGLEAVTPEKQRRLRALAAAWMAAHRDQFAAWGLVGPIDIRIDVAAVRIERRQVVGTDWVHGAC
jgi:putative endonuclease